MNASLAAHGESLLQPVWDSMRSEEFLRSPCLFALYAYLTHVLFCLPYLVLDMLAGVSPQVEKWRISAGSSPAPTLRQWLSSSWTVLRNYLTYVLPLTVILQLLWEPAAPERAPSCAQLLLDVAACLLVFDSIFFAWHFSLHKIPRLYRIVHQHHHQYRHTFAMTAQDSNPPELLSLLVMALASTWVVGCHPLTEAVFHIFNIWLAVEDHCGYNLPWAVHRMLPFMGGAPSHQDHHVIFRGNYAPYFTHWDRLFGTYFPSTKDPNDPAPDAAEKSVNLKNE